jgi:RND family efflux transporter MFP subunit
MAVAGDQLTTDLAALKIDREEPPRRSLLRPLIYLILVGAVVAAVWLFALPALKAQVVKREVEVTEIALISPAQAQVELTATGYVQALTVGKVAAKVVGRLAELKVKEGAVVKKGDVIAVLEDSLARSTLATARAQVQAARARAATQRAQLAEINLQAGREKALSDKGVSAKATYEDLSAKLRSLAEGVRAAEADVGAAEAQANALEVSLGDMTVTSPIDGTVVEKHADPGELVGPQTGNTIVDIVDFNSLIVEVDVTESKLRLLKVGTPGEIVLDAFPDRRYRGAALEIGKKVDRSKATVKVKVRFVDPPEGALPDMAARVNFLQKELELAQMKEPPKQVVAQSAVLDRPDGSKIVFVVADDRLRAEMVQVGDKLGDAYVLNRGPIPGTKVVANPTADLREGQSIKEKSN